MIPRRSFLLPTMFAAAFLASSPLYAQQPTKEARTAAAEAYKTGLEEGNRGEWEAARVHFTQAYSVIPEHNGLWNLAVSEQKTGHLVEALRHFRMYLKETDPQAKKKDEAKTRIADISLKTGRLRIKAGAGRAVRVDRKARTEEELRDAIDVLPGRHSVEAGGELRDVEIAANQDVTVSFEPVSSKESREPPPKSSLAPAPQKESNPARLWTTVGLGAGAVLLVAGGAFFGAKSSSKADDAETLQERLPPGACRNPATPGCADLDSAISSANNNRTASILMYSGAGVLAAGAVAAWFLIPAERETRTAVVPLVGPGVVGAHWTTRF